MTFSLPLIPPARMTEYLDLLEYEVGHFQSPSTEAFGHEMLAYIRFSEILDSTSIIELLFKSGQHMSTAPLAMEWTDGSGVCMIASRKAK